MLESIFLAPEPPPPPPRPPSPVRQGKLVFLLCEGGLFSGKIHVFLLRLRDSYQRIVALWICIIHGFVLIPGAWILTFKDSIWTSRNESGLKKVQFELLTTNPANFQRFDLFSQIHQIIMNLKYYTTKRNPNPYESRLADSWIQICECRSLKIRLADSFRKNKIPK